MRKIVNRVGLGEMIAALQEEGRKVLGPVARDGVITHDVITTVDDLPAGWTEAQDGGSYRLMSTGTDELFAYSSPSTSWKRFLYPERTLLIRATRRDGQVEVTQPEPDPTSLAFFGVRSCDLAALGVLDGVFLDPTATDPTYSAVRTDVFIVAAACANPGGTCFCASMNTGPSPTSGYDLAVAELHTADRHDFLVDAGSDRGAELLAAVRGRPAETADDVAAQAAHERAVQSMGRELDPTLPPRAAAHPDHPRWDDVAERCLACGNCTMVCPTCFCSTTHDTTDLIAESAERWRSWDSCFSLDFTYMHGGPVRATTKSRYRQWLLHKLVTWHDQFGTSGCVGCGRCITWCPVGIDLTEEARALAQ